MRVLPLVGFCFVTMALGAFPAKADVQTYCEAYARDQADAYLSGSAVLGSHPKLATDEREARKTLAFADCLALYSPKPTIEVSQEEVVTVTPADPIPIPRPKPKTTERAKQETPVTRPAQIAAVKAPATLPRQKKRTAAGTASPVPGSKAWKNYCAAKYASYNPATDTFTSLSGQQRPCRVTGSAPPARPAKSEVSPRPAKSELPTRAAKSEPLAPGEKSPWDSFDNPKLKVSR